MRRCNIITDKDGKEMFVRDAEMILMKLLPPLEYILNKGYHTIGYPTVRNIVQDYNEAVHYDENTSQSSTLHSSYHTNCVKETYKYLKYYVEKEGVTTGDVYVGSNNIEGNNVSIGYDEGYVHHRTYAENGKFKNVIYKIENDNTPLTEIVDKYRKENEEAIGYELKEIDEDFVRQHLDPKLYIDEDKGMRFGEPMQQEQTQEQQTPEEHLVNAMLTNGQVVVQPNENGTVTVPAGTATGDVHIDFEDDDIVETITGDFNDEPVDEPEYDD